MNTHAIAKTLNARRHAKPIAVAITALFVVSMLSAFSLVTVQAAPTTSALHTQGSYILDANGNSVYLRGMGLAGFAPNLMLWGSGQSDNWGNQWNTDTAVMDQTFQTMQSTWHINMIRVFVYPSWYYRDNIIPAVEDPTSYGSHTTPISIKSYLRTLAQEADRYGIYVDIVPYMMTPYSGSFAADKYATPSFGWQGMPMMGWDDAATRFLSDAGYANNEQGFWSWFWTDMGNTFKDLPNVILEAWNEPNVGGDADPIPAGYMTYLTTMYSAIRSTGATNLIMMQWHMGWFPNGYGNDLSWAKQIATAIPNANNLVYTTHLYYYAPTDLSSYWASDYAGLKAQLQTGINSMGVTAPLVVNEEGSCLNSSPNKQNDLTWWTNVLAAQRDLNIGSGAYYWLSDQGLGPVYAGETMLSNSNIANSMGQAFINAYKPATVQIEKPTATATPAPTITPAAPIISPIETPTATITPTASPEPTAAPTQNTIPPLIVAPSTPNSINTTAPTPTATNSTTEPTTPTPEPTPEPDRLFDPVQGFFYRNWFTFYWPKYQSWFAFHFW